MPYGYAGMSDGSGQVEWEHLEICVEADLSGTEVVLDVMLHHSNTTNASSSPVEVLPEAVRGSVQLVLSNVPATIITIDLLRYVLAEAKTCVCFCQVFINNESNDELFFLSLKPFSFCVNVACVCAHAHVYRPICASIAVLK